MFEPLLELDDCIMAHLDFLHSVFLDFQFFDYFLRALIEHSCSFLLMQLHCICKLLPVVLDLLDSLNVVYDFAIDLRFVLFEPVLNLKLVLGEVFSQVQVRIVALTANLVEFLVFFSHFCNFFLAVGHLGIDSLH